MKLRDASSNDLRSIVSLTTLLKGYPYPLSIPVEEGNLPPYCRRKMSLSRPLAIPAKPLLYRPPVRAYPQAVAGWASFLTKSMNQIVISRPAH